MSNPFFKNKGPFLILNILNFLDIKNETKIKNVEVKDDCYGMAIFKGILDNNSISPT